MESKALPGGPARCDATAAGGPRTDAASAKEARGLVGTTGVVYAGSAALTWAHALVLKLRFCRSTDVRGDF